MSVRLELEGKQEFVAPLVPREPRPEHAVDDPERAPDRERQPQIAVEESFAGAAPEERHTYAGDNRGYVLRRLLALSDLIALAASGAVAATLVVASGRPEVTSEDVIAFVICVLAWLPLAMAAGLYHLPDRRLGPSGADEIGPIVFALTLWSWGFLVLRAILGEGAPVIFSSVAVWVLALLAVPALRALTRAFARHRLWYEQRAAVIGTPADVGRVVRRLKRHPELRLNVAGRVTFDAATNGDGRHATNGDQLTAVVDELIQRLAIHRVIVASAPGDMDQRSELIRSLVDLHVHVDIVSADSDAMPSRGSLHYLEGLPMLTISAVRQSRSRQVGKRAFDLVAASLGLVILSPVMAYCAIRIRIESSGPALFKQDRVGRGGRSFEMVKFRTMCADADRRKDELRGLNEHAATETPGMFKIRSDPRATRFGLRLRRWSIDELPQLWNVVRGDMSLVGPRPLIPEEAELVSGHHEARLSVRPGITGPWQTLGRSDIGFEDMVKLDYTYVVNPSFAEDMKLLMRTIGAVARRRGAY